jgi:hypothetical protein
MNNVKKILSMAMLMVFFGVPIAIQTRSLAGAADLPQTNRKTDEKRLTGRWIRPDGGYILELKDIKKDGKLKASYFNPSSINVFRAEWNRKEGKINLFVELRDVNYPGSKYTLQYDPESDRLTGTYFQAVYRETYDIEFKRIK